MSTLPGSFCAAKENNLRRKRQQHYGDSFLGSQQKRLSSPHRIASLRNDRPLNSQYSSPSLLDSLRQQKAKVDRNWSFHAKNKQRDDAMLLSQCAGRSNVILTSSAADLGKSFGGAPPAVGSQRLFDARRKEQISRKSSLPRCSDEVQMEERVLSESTISTVDESLFSKAKSHASPRSDDFLRVNIGGSHFTVRKETIARRKTGRLSWLLNVAHTQRMPLVDGYFESSDEYYFERSPVLFHIVYQFYLTGCIHQPNHVCPQDLLDELEYWGIAPLDHLAPCCCADDEEDEDVVKEEEEVEAAPPNPFKHLKFGEFRRKVWTLIEEPTSSIYSQIFASFSILFVLVSISGLVLGSIPEFQMPVFKKNPADNASLQVVEMEPHPALSHIEHLCIVWFSLEYFSKMIVSADRKRTFLQLLNIIDLLAILPFIMEMALMVVGINTEQLRDLKGAFLVIRILRVLRVIRVLKLGRYSSGLQMFGKTLQASFRQLGMMAMVVLTGVIFFSTLVYFLEKDEPGSQFHSIPAACWWCIVTMTTVGYGDLTPVTVPGKLVATGAIACGVLVLALPITIIVDNFMKVAEGERRPNDSVGGIRRLGPRARITVGDNVEAVVSPPRPLNRRRLRQSTSFSSTAPLNSSGTVSSGNNGRIALAEKDADC